MKKSDVSDRAVIMCGISGSGKTYHALRLVQQGYIRLSVDSHVWQKVGPGIGRLTRAEQNALYDECRARVREELALLLKAGRKVVVDATHCRRSVRDDIRRVCAEAGVKPVFVFCMADEDVLWDRLSRRKGTDSDDLIVTREELSRYWRGFERPQPDETDFRFIDGDDHGADKRP